MVSSVADAVPLSDDQLDIEDALALHRYLIQEGIISPSDHFASAALPGGVSNRTVLVNLNGRDRLVIKQALARLRVSTEWLSDRSRIHTEACGLRWLSGIIPGRVPEFFFEDEPNFLLGMSAVEDCSGTWKSEIFAGRIEASRFTDAAEILSAIHVAGTDSLEARTQFSDKRFFDSLRLEPYYRFTAGRVTGAAEFLNVLQAECAGISCTVTHGDFSPKNLLVTRRGLVLIDHEVIHIGDPAFDVGFVLAHFLSKVHRLPELRPQLLNAVNQFASAYLRSLSRMPWAAEVENRSVRHALGCLLARAAGRSQVEYLAPEQKERQIAVVLSLINNPPCSIPQLADQFERLLNADGNY